MSPSSGISGLSLSSVVAVFPASMVVPVSALTPHLSATAVSETVPGLSPRNENFPSLSVSVICVVWKFGRWGPLARGIGHDPAADERLAALVDQLSLERPRFVEEEGHPLSIVVCERKNHSGFE